MIERAGVEEMLLQKGCQWAESLTEEIMSIQAQAFEDGKKATREEFYCNGCQMADYFEKRGRNSLLSILAADLDKEFDGDGAVQDAIEKIIRRYK